MFSSLPKKKIEHFSFEKLDNGYVDEYRQNWRSLTSFPGVCLCVCSNRETFLQVVWWWWWGGQLLFSRVSESAGNGHRERERQLFLIKKENSLFLLK